MTVYVVLYISTEDTPEIAGLCSTREKAAAVVNAILELSEYRYPSIEAVEVDATADPIVAGNRFYAVDNESQRAYKVLPSIYDDNPIIAPNGEAALAKHLEANKGDQ